MPRSARLRAPGYPLHIVHRGHNGNDCFRCDHDFQRYLAMLKEASSRHECQVHAFVLMTNHVHLLVTSPTESGASLMMKHVAQKHAQALNRREGRMGSFWSDRFYSSLVQCDGYFLACHRYIEMNPIRAGLASKPWQYPWSSYRHNAEGDECGVLTPHSVYLSLGVGMEGRQRAYRSLFTADLEPDTVEQFRAATRSGRAVGDDRFHRLLGERLGVPTRPRRPGRPNRNRRPG